MTAALSVAVPGAAASGTTAPASAAGSTSVPVRGLGSVSPERCNLFNLRLFTSLERGPGHSPVEIFGVFKALHDSGALAPYASAIGRSRPTIFPRARPVRRPKGKPGRPPAALSVAVPGTTTTGTTAPATATGTTTVPVRGLGSVSPARLHARAGWVKAQSGVPRLRSGVAMMTRGASGLTPVLPAPVLVLRWTTGAGTSRGHPAGRVSAICVHSRFHFYRRKNRFIGQVQGSELRTNANFRWPRQIVDSGPAPAMTV